MKKALLALGLLWSAVANAQFTPGQLLTAAELNTQFALYAPLAGATFTGSVAANAGLTASAITGTPVSGSTGSFTTLSASSTVTLPAGSLSLTNLATQAANTIVANGTGSTASPTAISAPSCSTSSSALQWVSGTGLACNSAINASTLGGATFASPGAIGSGTASTGSFTGLAASGTVSGTGFVNLLAPYALLASPSFTGAITVTNSATSGSTLLVNATSNTATGSAIFLGGNGATTPNKYLGVFNGIFFVDNSAGSTQIFTLTDAGNATFVGSVSPSQTGGIIGTTTNNNANTGSVGEYVSSTITSGVSISSATPTNLTSISLTAGDWDIQGNILFTNGTGTTSVNGIAGINNSSNTLPSPQNYGFVNGISVGTTASFNVIAPVQRYSIASTTTIYLVGQAQFSGGTCSQTGFLRARRVR